MNLYMLVVQGRINYDQYDAAIVAAESEAEARLVHPKAKDELYPFPLAWHEATQTWHSDEPDSDFCDYDPYHWPPPHALKCELIGTAAAGVAAGVVLASFNAG